MTPFSLRWQGEPHAPPMLLLHGFMGGPEDWEPAAAQIQGWRLGFVGLLKPCPPEDLARHLINAAGSPSAIAGYSMGGRLAIHLATRNPASFPLLIALSATPGLEDEQERAARRNSDATLARRLRSMTDPAAFRQFLLEEWRAQPLFAGQGSSPSRLSEQRIAARLNRPRDDMAAQLGLWGQGTLESSWPLLRTWPGHALLIAGTNDLSYAETATRMAGILPNAELAMIEGAGHDLLGDAPEAVARAINSIRNSRFPPPCGV